jgi:putative (di)nucleoside polyphosphate hydrolase
VRYDLPHDLVPRIWKGKYRGQQQKWVLLRYRGDDGQIDIAGAHPEFSSWRWLAPDAVVAQIVPFKRAVYEQALRALRPYL